MMSAVYYNTTNCKFGFFWPSLGHKRDWDFGNRIGSFVQKNERVLNKKAMDDACKIVAEEFPELVEIDVRDYANRGARWRA
jgi:hypothetical protein